MIRLSLAQIRMAEIAAEEVHEVERTKDLLPAGEMILARTEATRDRPLSPRIEVEVPRAAVMARLNERRETALETLKALGIELDPGV